MELEELERLADKVEALVDELKQQREINRRLLSEKASLEQKVASLLKQLDKFEKEGNRIEELVAENKANKKKLALLKAKVTSMLAKVEVLQ
ncbi:MAG TPA: hypothetical protein ENI46_03050 [Firmicutes bacterium]|nr:hypothetical protein [Bacillota bacterium]